MYIVKYFIPIFSDQESLEKNVKVKAKLNKSILSMGWFEFRRQLQYKAEWKGGMVIAVNPAYTSQTCSACAHVSKKNRRSQSKFECVNCGHSENADFNAAKNILRAGLNPSGNIGTQRSA